MKKYYLNIFLIFMSLISCQEKEKNNRLLEYSEKFGTKKGIREIKTSDNSFKTISIPNDINEKFIEYNKLIKSVDYVQLETNKQCLISEINKLFFLGDNIVIVDDLQHKVFLFSQNGKFITQIGKIGKGPNEYIKLTDVFIDYHKNRIITYDNVTQKLFFYDEKGIFIKNENIYLFATKMALLGDKTLLLHTLKDNNEHVPDIMNYQLIFYDIEKDDVKKKILGKGLSYSSPVYNEKIYVHNDITFNAAKNYVLFTPLFTNNIYKIENQKTISLKYHIDLGNKDCLNNLKDFKSHDEFNSVLNDDKKWLFDGFNLEAGNYLFSTIQNAGFFFYNEKTDKLFYGNGLMEIHTYEEDKSLEEKRLPLAINKTLTTKGDDFVSVCYPSDLQINKENNNFMKFKNLKKPVYYSDNPILIFYSIQKN